MKKIIPFLIILFWLTMTFLLISRYAPDSSTDIKSQSLPQEGRQRWMGIYLKGQKIGFTSSRFEKEIDGYAAYEEIKMKIMVLGIMQDIYSRTSVLLSPALKVRSFKFTLNAAQKIEVDGNIRDKTLILDITTANNKSRREIMLDEAPQMTLTIIPYLLQRGLKSGMKIRLPVFDPVTFSTQKMLIEVVGKEKINLNNSEVVTSGDSPPQQAFKIKRIRLGRGIEQTGINAIQKIRKKRVRKRGQGRKRQAFDDLARADQIAWLDFRRIGIRFFQLFLKSILQGRRRGFDLPGNDIRNILVPAAVDLL